MVTLIIKINSLIVKFASAKYVYIKIESYHARFNNIPFHLFYPSVQIH